ncbi:hypothetical protein EJ02DRAFT_164290 [Clathrospora elynae]|uniref:Uncharacterized protein n=1 Tax=Clathrospora elynae TaxID=706981 RepID=A0A6A5S5X8_9PLEO|nr:hypothetical protein EJ02DRAFT_164290 [Clathrospora elynae]
MNFDLSETSESWCSVWKARCMVRSRGMQGWFSGMNGIRIEGVIHRQQMGLSVKRIEEERQYECSRRGSLQSVLKIEQLSAA